MDFARLESLLERNENCKDSRRLMTFNGPSIENLNEPKIFTREGAQQLLPVVMKTTEKHQQEIKRLTSQLNALGNFETARADEVQAKIDSTMNRWQDNIRRLGAVPKGVWNVDFDCGNGYYCWKFPETEIRYWHGYKDGFPGRVEIAP